MMSAKKYDKNVCVSLREGKYEPQKLKHLSNKLFFIGQRELSGPFVTANEVTETKVMQKSSRPNKSKPHKQKF